MSHDGGAAFPVLAELLTHDNNAEHTSVGGMRLRDYFAAQALIAFGMHLGVVGRVASQDGAGRVATWAAASYELADAMLKEREK